MTPLHKINSNQFRTYYLLENFRSCLKVPSNNPRAS